MEQQLELVELGVADEEAGGARAPDAADDPANLAYLVRRDGQVYAGTHLLIDVHEARDLDDIARIEAMLRRAVTAVGATLLHMDLHRFSENGGISGVALLAESHISIHTWPEINYAAIDIFVCGGCDPRQAIPVFETAFAGARLAVSEHRRGIVG